MMGNTLNAVDPVVATAVTLALGVTGAAWTVVAPRPLAVPARRAALVVAGLLATATGLVLLSGHLLTVLGYTPVTLVLGWFVTGMWPAYLTTLTTPETFFQAHLLLGALVWAAAALGCGRRLRGGCGHCGRTRDWSPEHETRTRRRALRTGRVAVAVAVTCALGYPAMRLPWLFGIPVGMDDAAWEEMRSAPELVAVGVGLGAAALVGAVLVLGLVATWGVRFPRWMLGLSGRRVPVALAVLPASVIALSFVAIGRGFLIAIVAHNVSTPVGADPVHVGAIVAMLPYGAALLVATAAYALRRRAGCATCARGLPEDTPR